MKMKKTIAVFILFVAFIATGCAHDHYLTADLNKASSCETVDDTLGETLYETTYEYLIEDSDYYIADCALDIYEALDNTSYINEAICELMTAGCFQCEFMLNELRRCLCTGDPASIGATKMSALDSGCACSRAIICIEEALHNHEVHCIDFLETLSNEELRELYAPFARIADIINERYGCKHHSWMNAPCVHDSDGRDVIMSTLSTNTLAMNKRLIFVNMRGSRLSDNWTRVLYETWQTDLSYLARVRIFNLMSLRPEAEQKMVDYLDDGVCIGDVFKLITGRDAYEVYCIDVCCVM